MATLFFYTIAYAFHYCGTIANEDELFRHRRRRMKKPVWSPLPPTYQMFQIQ